MATQYHHTCILGYVIAIILILSNVKIVFANKNNQYATTTATTATTARPFENAREGTDDPVAVSSTQQFHTSTSNKNAVSELATTARNVGTKSISALHGGVEFMQQTLHNTSSTLAEESRQQRKNLKEVQYKQVERALNINGGNSNDQQQRMHSEYLVQQDDDNENPKQLLSTMQPLSLQRDRQPNSNEKRHNHAQVIQQHNDRSATPLSYHDRFMNENKKTPNAIESNTGITVTPVNSAKMRNAQLNKHNQPFERNNSSNSSGISGSNINSSSTTESVGVASVDNNDDSRKTDEITAMPMKIVREHRDNVNATSDAVFRVNESDAIATVNKTLTFDNNGSSSANDMANAKHMVDSDDEDDDSDSPFSLESSSNQEFNERSRYLETDLDELPEASDNEQDDVNVNDQLEWPDDANQFEELTLNDDENIETQPSIQARSWNENSPNIGSRESITAAPTHNILKLTKSNKSKAMKRVAAAPPPQSPQALLEIRLNKSPPPMSTENEKQFINSQSFRYITNLYDQYEWDADELRVVLSTKCASDMDVYLDALARGKIWAAKGNDFSFFCYRLQYTDDFIADILNSIRFCIRCVIFIRLQLFIDFYEFHIYCFSSIGYFFHWIFFILFFFFHRILFPFILLPFILFHIVSEQ